MAERNIKTKRFTIKFVVPRHKGVTDFILPHVNKELVQPMEFGSRERDWDVTSASEKDSEYEVLSTPHRSQYQCCTVPFRTYVHKIVTYVTRLSPTGSNATAVTLNDDVEDASHCSRPEF